MATAGNSFKLEITSTGNGQHPEHMQGIRPVIMVSFGEMPELVDKGGLGRVQAYQAVGHMWLQ